MNFYNDNNTDCTDQIRYLIEQGLIPNGLISSQDIRLVEACDLTGFDQVHLFAGCGGWSHALDIAGLSREPGIWTCSCPCQPFSNAGRQRGTADERHLWPEALRLITECRPPVVFGEQVASKAGVQWLATVRSDLEALGYAVGAADLPACCVGAPHERQRLYWVADAEGERGDDEAAQRAGSDTHRPRTEITDDSGSPGGRGRIAAWSWWDAEPEVARVVNGIPADLGPIIRMFGNAIVPPLAAEFIETFYEARAVTWK